MIKFKLLPLKKYITRKEGKGGNLCDKICIGCTFNTTRVGDYRDFYFVIYVLDFHDKRLEECPKAKLFHESMHDPFVGWENKSCCNKFNKLIDTMQNIDDLDKIENVQFDKI